MLRKSSGGYKPLAFLLVAAMALVGSAALPSSADADVADGVVTSLQELQQAVSGIPADGKRHTITVDRTLTFGSSVTINRGKDVALEFSSNTELKHESGNFPLFSITDGSQLTLSGAAYNDQRNGRLADVVAGKLTIDSGTYSGNTNQSGDAAVVYVSKEGTLEINGGTFAKNTSTATGGATGGAVIHSSGKVTVNDGTFDGNSTGTNQRSNRYYHGGGVIWSDGTLIVNNGSFTNNRSNAVHYDNGSYEKYPTGGGAIWASNHLVINGGTFRGNWQMDNTMLYATGGGAIYFGDGTKRDNGTMIINGGTFDGNRSMQDGGAIFMAWNSKAVFQQGKFTNNWSNRLGGAVYTEEDTTSYVTNAAAYENHAGHFGGGLWLCPSGKGGTLSKHAGMALFDNKASVEYDRTEDGNLIWNSTQGGKAYNSPRSDMNGVPGAGDDFAIMYPNKGNGITNYFELSMEWFTGDTISWHDDGQPTKKANGFLYGRDELSVSNQMSRPDGGEEYTTNGTLNPGTVDHGYGLKATGITDTARQNAKNHAFITFTKNTARLSGGAFGSDGDVTFTKVRGVKWYKVSSVDGNRKLPGSKWLLVAQNDDSVKSGPLHLDFGNVQGCSSDGSGSITPTEGAWCKIPDSVTDNRYSEFAGKYVTVVADNSATDKNPADGQFKVKGLRNGTYYLKEYQSPDGYTQSQKTYTFTINDADHPSITVSKDSGTSGSMLSDGFSITNTPYGTVKWTKVDSADGLTALPGSKWKLQNDDGTDIQGAANITDCTDKCTSTQDNPYQDTDPGAGSFALTYLPLGSYRLVETTAPNGYALPDGTKTYYKFTVTEANHMDVPVYRSDGRTPLNGGAVPNEHVKGNVTWYKTDSTKEGKGSNARLKGSKWSLTQIKDWKGNDIASGQRPSITVIDCVSEKACPANLNDRDGAAGEFQVKDLDWGTYELRETRAPNGFRKSDTVYTFVIDERRNGTAKIQIMNGNDPVQDNIITNVPITVSSLPFTGSGALTPHAFLPYVLGAVGAGLAAGLGLHMIRRRIARQG